MIISDSIIISQKPNVIWTLITNISNWSRWSPAINHAAIYGPFETNTRFKCISGKWEFECYIAEVDPDKIFTFNAKAIGLVLTMTWQLSSESNGIKVTATVSPSGWIAALFRNRVNKNLENAIHSWLSSLKARAERGEAIKLRAEGNYEELAERPGSIFTTPFTFLSDLKKSRERKKTPRR